MKTQPAHIAPKGLRFRPILLSAILLIVSTAALQAQKTGDSSAASQDSALVKHLGNAGPDMVFQVLYNNPSGEKFVLMIKDRDNTTLYQEAYTVKKLDKKFRVPKMDNEQLTFIIKGIKSAPLSQSFEVNTNTRLVEEFVVQKMN